MATTKLYAYASKGAYWWLANSQIQTAVANGTSVPTFGPSGVGPFYFVGYDFSWPTIPAGAQIVKATFKWKPSGGTLPTVNDYTGQPFKTSLSKINTSWYEGQTTIPGYSGIASMPTDVAAANQWVDTDITNFVVDRYAGNVVAYGLLFGDNALRSPGTVYHYGKDQPANWPMVEIEVNQAPRYATLTSTLGSWAVFNPANGIGFTIGISDADSGATITAWALKREAGPYNARTLIEWWDAAQRKWVGTETWNAVAGNPTTVQVTEADTLGTWAAGTEYYVKASVKDDGGLAAQAYSSQVQAWAMNLLGPKIVHVKSSASGEGLGGNQCIAQLSTGRLLLARGRENGGTCYMYLHYSDDGGRNWQIVKTAEGADLTFSGFYDGGFYGRAATMRVDDDDRIHMLTVLNTTITYSVIDFRGAAAPVVRSYQLGSYMRYAGGWDFCVKGGPGQVKTIYLIYLQAYSGNSGTDYVYGRQGTFNPADNTLTFDQVFEIEHYTSSSIAGWKFAAGVAMSSTGAVKVIYSEQWGGKIRVYDWAAKTKVDVAVGRTYGDTSATETSYITTAWQGLSGFPKPEFLSWGGWFSPDYHKQTLVYSDTAREWTSDYSVIYDDAMWACVDQENQVVYLLARRETPDTGTYGPDYPFLITSQYSGSSFSNSTKGLLGQATYQAPRGMATAPRMMNRQVIWAFEDDNYIWFDTMTFNSPPAAGTIPQLAAAGYTMNRRPAFTLPVSDPDNLATITNVQVQVDSSNAFPSGDGAGWQSGTETGYGTTSAGFTGLPAASGGVVKFTPPADVATGQQWIRYRVRDNQGAWSSWSTAQQFTVQDAPWTDAVPDQAHGYLATWLNQVGDAINAARQFRGMPAAVFTDGVLQRQTYTYKATHITERRQALTELYTALGRPAPVWTDPTLTRQAQRRVGLHISELRSYAQQV